MPAFHPFSIQRTPATRTTVPGDRPAVHLATAAAPVMRYSLAHETAPSRRILGPRQETFTRYAAAPIVFTRPQKGVSRTTVTCPTCQKKITVLVRSPAAVRLERWKRAIYVALIATAFYGFAVLIPWHSLLGNNDACVGLLALFAFGFVALHNGAQVIASEAVLLVGLAGKPLLDIFPSLGSEGSHTILRRNG